MNYSVAEMAIGVGIFMVFVAILSYFIGQKKSNSPIKSALIGFVFSIIPALGIAYLIYLFSRENVENS